MGCEILPHVYKEFELVTDPPHVYKEFELVTDPTKAKPYARIEMCRKRTTLK